MTGFTIFTVPPEVLFSILKVWRIMLAEIQDLSLQVDTAERLSQSVCDALSSACEKAAEELAKIESMPDAAKFALCLPGILNNFVTEVITPGGMHTSPTTDKIADEK